MVQQSFKNKIIKKWQKVPKLNHSPWRILACCVSKERRTSSSRVAASDNAVSGGKIETAPISSLKMEQNFKCPLCTACFEKHDELKEHLGENHMESDVVLEFAAEHPDKPDSVGLVGPSPIPVIIRTEPVSLIS